MNPILILFSGKNLTRDCRINFFWLVYDILIYENQLPDTIAFVDQHFSQVFILDHIAKPVIGENLLNIWSENIRELVKRENACCKISVKVIEADFNAGQENN